MIPFEFYRVRLHLRARGPLRFPIPAANLLRGALGYRLEDRQQDYARWFRPGRTPEGGPAPSGLADWPRPFVLRASHLDGTECHPEECWSFDVHIFAREAVWPLLGALAGAAERGMGRGRVASKLLRIEALDLDNGGTDFSPGSDEAPTRLVPPICLNLAVLGKLSPISMPGTTNCNAINTTWIQTRYSIISGWAIYRSVGPAPSKLASNPKSPSAVIQTWNLASDVKR